MKKNNMCRALYASLLAVGITTAVSVFGQQTTNWVAINDHQRGTASSPYANFYNPLLNDAGLSGPLTNTVNYSVLAQGARTPASINITTNGGSVSANSMSGPNAGTPAGDWFRPYVDFGGSSRIAIQLNGTSTITYTFNGLDPSKRYIFKGTAARGGSYADRWTTATLDNANSYTHAHKPTWAEAPTSPNFGVLTSADVPAGNLAANQAAWNSGENRAAGAMIVFTDIDPGPDGSFSVTVQTYKGTVPGGSSAGSYGYAFSAFSVEEINVVTGPPQITTQPPATMTINETANLTISVGALGGVNYQWYFNGTPINSALNPTATNSTLVITNAMYTNSGNYYLYIANQYGATNSSVVSVTVIRDLTPPTIAGALGLLLATNLPPQQPYTLTDILVTFSEAVTPETATVPGNYEVYKQGSASDQLTVYSATMTSPSNVLLRTDARIYLQNYTLRVNNITDRSSAHNKIAAGSTFNIWHELSLFTYTEDDFFAPTNSWKYDESGTDHGPYWYTNSADFFSTWMDGWELFAAKSGSMPTYMAELIRTQLTPPDVSRIRTYYFWRTFEFPSNVDPKLAELRMRYIIDDGAVMYLNKREFYSIGMPTNRPVYFTNLANRTMGDAPYEPTTNDYAVIQPYYVVPNDNLRQGVNELAVEVHQVNDTSSDMYFGAILTAVVPPVGQAVKPWFTLGPTPTNTVTALGSRFNLRVEALGTTPITYSWYFVRTNTTTWTLLAGQNTTNLVITNLTANNSGTYYAVAANSMGSVTSTPAFLTVVLPPVITSQPVSVTTNVGATVSFSVAATGTPPLAYQWYWNNVPVSGGNAATLVLSSVASYQGGQYYVVVTDVGGSTTSQVATLTLPPDTVKPTLTMALGLIRATNYPPTQPPLLTEILLTYSEPVNPTTATNVANYKVDRYGGGQSLAVSKAVMVNETNVILITATPRTLYTNYIVTVNNVTDMSPQSNVIEPNTKFNIYHELPLIFYGPTNDVAYAWKYDFSKVDYSGQFYQPSFNDSGWQDGWMLFEFKSGTVPALPETIGTLYTTIDSSVITYYFRKHFYFPTGFEPRSAELRLRHVIDDGAIFYMNGNEFYSIRMPTTPRPMTWSQQANATVGDAAYGPATAAGSIIQPYYTVTNIYLQSGDNVLAVEVHQNGTASSDITFGMILTAVVPPAAVNLPQITTQPQSITTNYGATVQFTVGALDPTSLSYQWYHYNMPVSGANSATLVLTNVQSYNGGEYYVVVSNPMGSVTSQVAVLTLPPEHVPPTLTMALGLLRATNYPPTQAPLLTEILLTFSEPVDPTTATSIANYRVDRYDGVENLPVVSAVMIDATRVLITTATPRTLNQNYTLTVNNIKDLSMQHNVIIANTKFDIYQEIPLIYYGSTSDTSYAWKFDYSGTDYSGQFYQVGFDDSAWANCWMLVEGKRGTVPAFPENIGTQLPTVDTNNYIYTYYFRKHFSFPSGIDPKLAELRLRYIIDDGAIFYMNGSEFYSVRMTNSPRPMTWNTQATASVGDATYEPAININAIVQPYYTVTNNYLQNGDNVIAVEVHQNGTASSDVTFGMILTAVVPPIGVPVRPPQIAVQPQSVSTNYGATVEFAVQATGGMPLSYQWYFNNSPISGANSAALVLTGVQSYQGGNYFVVITNLGGAVTSQVATLTLPPDTVPPTLLMAVGLLRATNYPPTLAPSYTDILLTFSEPLESASAQNTANYAVNRHGGGSLQVSRALLINMTNVLITTAAPREPFVSYDVVVSNVKDASVQHTSIVTTNFAMYQEVPLVYIADTNHTWKYDMSRTDFGTNWLKVDFDDSGWTSGVALFEAKRGTVPGLPEPVRTLLPAPTTNASEFVRTYYYRTHFTIPEGVDLQNAQLYLRHIVDDGAVFYVNGSEVFAFKMPTNRPVTINDSALAPAIGNAAYDPAVDPAAIVQPAYLITNANLKIGDNVIAVEVHQDSGTDSSDTTFGMNLTAVIPPVSGVTPPASVVISQTFVVNNKISMKFASQTGWTYYLESSAGLETQNLSWSVVTSVQGDGSNKVLEDNVASGRKFYRLRAVKN